MIGWKDDRCAVFQKASSIFAPARINPLARHDPIAGGLVLVPCRPSVHVRASKRHTFLSIEKARHATLSPRRHLARVGRASRQFGCGARSLGVSSMHGLFGDREALLRQPYW